jgi:hypothetical protein
VQARAAAALGDKQSAGDMFQRTREALGSVRQSVGEENINYYLARPDVQSKSKLIDASAR